MYFQDDDLGPGFLDAFANQRLIDGVFSGIVETNSKITKCERAEGLLRIAVARPMAFDDLKIGDSVCTDGVCLTVEKFDHEKIVFALGSETLKITGWDEAKVLDKTVNLERSLRLNDRIHGHLVTGHVDASAEVLEIKDDAETRFLKIGFPKGMRPFLWTKGSVTINGVSLTLNLVDDDGFTLGLIPETLKRTNLGLLKVGDHVNLEIDNMARGLIQWARLQGEK